MAIKHYQRVMSRYTACVIAVVVMLCAIIPARQVGAVTFTPPGPKGTSYGVELKIDGPAPTEAARITSPTTGQSFSDLPVTVTGTCPKDLLVKIMVNGVMAGSAFCADGTFSVPVSLYSGQNDIVAYVFDNLDQEGPVSNTVSVTFNNANFSAFGVLMTLTSNFARRAANPGSTLTWPLILTGGNGPYAISVDWGDGTDLELKSLAFAGNFDINHIYKQAGVYQLVVKATDTNGVSAFLQLTAVATGKPTAGVTVKDDEGAGKTTIQKILLWQPAIIILALTIPIFWLGRRYELSELRKQIERDAAKYTS
jgi:hypothetical protein